MSTDPKRYQSLASTIRNNILVKRDAPVGVSDTLVESLDLENNTEDVAEIEDNREELQESIELAAIILGIIGGVSSAFIHKSVRRGAKNDFVSWNDARKYAKNPKIQSLFKAHNNNPPHDLLRSAIIGEFGSKNYFQMQDGIGKLRKRMSEDLDKVPEHKIQESKMADLDTVKRNNQGGYTHKRPPYNEPSPSKVTKVTAKASKLELAIKHLVNRQIKQGGKLSPRDSKLLDDLIDQIKNESVEFNIPDMLTEAVRLPSKLDQVRMGTLYVLLNTAVTKKVTALPLAAPVATQMLDSLSDVVDELKKNGKATGKEAVSAFLKAVEGHFTDEMPPIGQLKKKFGKQLGEEVLDEGKKKTYKVRVRYSSGFGPAVDQKTRTFTVKAYSEDGAHTAVMSKAKAQGLTVLQTYKPKLHEEVDLFELRKRTKKSVIAKAARAGTPPFTVVIIDRMGKAVHQETTEVADAVPAFVHELQKRWHPNNYKISVEDKNGTQVFAEETTINEEVSGWVAMYDGKKLEIKNDGKIKGLLGAKEHAIKALKVPKSKLGLLSIKAVVDEAAGRTGVKSGFGKLATRPRSKVPKRGFWLTKREFPASGHGEDQANSVNTYDRSKVYRTEAEAKAAAKKKGKGWSPVSIAAIRWSQNQMSQRNEETESERKERMQSSLVRARGPLTSKDKEKAARAKAVTDRRLNKTRQNRAVESVLAHIAAMKEDRNIRANKFNQDREVVQNVQSIPGLRKAKFKGVQEANNKEQYWFDIEEALYKMGSGISKDALKETAKKALVAAKKKFATIEGCTPTISADKHGSINLVITKDSGVSEARTLQTNPWPDLEKELKSLERKDPKKAKDLALYIFDLQRNRAEDAPRSLNKMIDRILDGK